MNIDKLIENKKFIISIVGILIFITLLTQYYGHIDIGDYSDSAKYFADNYQAKIRNSHSYGYGFSHSPLLWITDSFILFKLSSLFFLGLIALSIYFITGKDKRALLLSIFSPVIWYMAPWVNPIQIASLCLLWAYYFINKYDEDNQIRNLIYCGLLLGLGWAFWNTILFFSIFLIICFMYNKKVSHLFYLLISIFVGLIPLFALDQFLFGFPFYTIIKTTFSNFSATLFGGIYGNNGGNSKMIIRLLFIFISIPFYFWTLYKPNFFRDNKKSMIFISLSLLLIATNPQIRYALSIAPIITLLLAKELKETQFRRQIICYLILFIIFIAPYAIQTKYSINNEIYGADISLISENLNNLHYSKEFPSDLIVNDLEEIEKNYPYEIFIVGNAVDDYQTLAHFYFGDNIKEFVSIQDYDLHLQNRTILFEKKLMPKPRINERRQIWIAGGISKNQNDDTDYSAIDYAIGIGEPVNSKDFVILKRYNILYLSKRI